MCEILIQKIENYYASTCNKWYTVVHNTNPTIKCINCLGMHDCLRFDEYAKKSVLIVLCDIERRDNNIGTSKNFINWNRYHWGKWKWGGSKLKIVNMMNRRRNMKLMIIHKGWRIKMKIKKADTKEKKLSQKELKKENQKTKMIMKKMGQLNQKLKRHVKHYLKGRCKFEDM